MSISMETLFTTALGLQAPWEVTEFKLDTGARRIDFEVRYQSEEMACPVCETPAQKIHSRMRRSWRHLDFFQYEAWVHAEVPRVRCRSCGKTSRIEVPWSRPGSHFTLLFEALAMSLCQTMTVAETARLLRVTAHRLWRSVGHYVAVARGKDDMSDVKLIGIDETSLRRGHQYVTVVHDLDAKRLLFATEGRGHETVAAFKADLIAHGGQVQGIAHVCMDMSQAYVKGVTEQLPQAQISFDRFHVIAMANDAMDKVRKLEMAEQPRVVRSALGIERKTVRALMWGMRRDARSWTARQRDTMYLLQRSRLKTARAWRLKEALRDAYRQAVTANNAEVAQSALESWMSWARRSRLEPFKKLALTLRERLPGVVRGMLDGRSNAYVEAMNGMLQQSKRAARGFRSAANFIAIAYLRMSKLTHLPVNPLQTAGKRSVSIRRYRDGRQVSPKTS
ncbi:ISL3 family transposase [Massilia antarctica]|nr:ISL3 family transposase [Massilia antarctica]